MAGVELIVDADPRQCALGIDDNGVVRSCGRERDEQALVVEFIVHDLALGRPVVRHRKLGACTNRPSTGPTPYPS